MLSTKTMENSFEKPIMEEAEDIFNKSYEGGLGDPQEGKYIVTATKLSADGKEIGGGWVESFDDFGLAEKCKEEIEKINPNHKPEIIEQQSIN
jgi:hypothetical protein